MHLLHLSDLNIRGIFTAFRSVCCTWGQTTVPKFNSRTYYSLNVELMINTEVSRSDLAAERRWFYFWMTFENINNMCQAIHSFICLVLCFHFSWLWTFVKCHGTSTSRECLVCPMMKKGNLFSVKICRFLIIYWMTLLRMFILDLPVEQPCMINGLRFTVFSPQARLGY